MIKIEQRCYDFNIFYEFVKIKFWLVKMCLGLIESFG